MKTVSHVPANLDEAALNTAAKAIREQKWCPIVAEIPHHELLTLLSIGIRSYWASASSPRPTSHAAVSTPAMSALRSGSKKAAVLRRDNYICYLCEKQIEVGEESIDHVIPKAKGGPNKMSNLRAAHRDCNHRKADMSLAEYRALYPLPAQP